MFASLKDNIQSGVAQVQRSAQEQNSPLPADFPSEVAKAAKILREFTDPAIGVDNIIPKEVIQNAKGLAIFTVLKAGFMWSGRVGTGLVIAKLEDGSWSPPSCINIGGVGVGFQMGADVTDFVVILNTPEAVKAFSHGENVTLGGNLSVTAGPKGVGGSVAGTIIEPAALYSYSKSKGLFAGVSLEGTVIIQRKDENKRFYQGDVMAEHILSGKVEKPSHYPNELNETISRAEGRE